MAHSPLANPSATRGVLETHQLHLKKYLGQHFLVDDNVVGRIIALANVGPDDVVLEVGPGIGTLTVALCATGAAVVSVERDATLRPALASTTSGCSRFALVHADAVAVARDVLEAPFGPPTAFVANLPYQVAATVVLRYFELLPSVRSATVMVQAEVADRMAARSGTKAYGAYTVKLALEACVAGRFAVSPTCFMPPPRVDSSVIRLERISDPVPNTLRRLAATLADAAFAQRRKTLRNSLGAALGVSGAALDDALAAAGIDGAVRAETLRPEAFVALARVLGS